MLCMDNMFNYMMAKRDQSELLQDTIRNFNGGGGATEGAEEAEEAEMI